MVAIAARTTATIVISLMGILRLGPGRVLVLEGVADLVADDRRRVALGALAGEGSRSSLRRRGELGGGEDPLP